MRGKGSLLDTYIELSGAIDLGSRELGHFRPVVLACKIVKDGESHIEKSKNSVESTCAIREIPGV